MAAQCPFAGKQFNPFAAPQLENPYPFRAEVRRFGAPRDLIVVRKP